MYLPTRLPETETRATDDPVALTLLRAAQVIRERGWCQGFASGPRGAHCIWGAIAVARGTSCGMDDSGAWRALKTVVGPMPIDWNDAFGRTADEVIAALESAALSRALAIRGK